MMKKYIIIVLVFLSSFILINKVNALSDTIYTYPTDTSQITAYTNTYKVTHDSAGLNTYNICSNVTNTCNFLDLDSWIYSAGSTSKFSGINKIIFYEKNNTVYFIVLFRKYNTYDLTQYYNTEPKIVLRNMIGNTTGTDRAVSVSLDLKPNYTEVWSGAYFPRYFSYNFSTTAITNLGNINYIPYSATGGDSQIKNENTQYKILYSNDNIYNAYDTLASITNEIYYKSDYNPLPNYLTGYKKVTLNKDTKYAYLSNLKKGRIYIPKSDFKKYGGKLGYWDIGKDYMNNDAIILDYKATDDWLYIYQDFDLSSYENSDLVVFNKFLYLENIDYNDFEYDIYVPEEMYVSLTKPIPNAEGGNDFPAKYQDENGNEISFTPKSEDLSMSEIEKTLYQISYSLRDNNLLAYFTNAWESLKLSKIYNYIILTITGGIIIFLFKVLHK